ncbi:MAG: DUF86 domain-containing protein [Rhizobiales bacterium]|nr:DUF86 domain-containing protein [Hyphomicrobiales bacterium]
MPSNSPELALTDIAANIALAQNFVRDFSFDEFQADRRTVYAVIRCLEIISEASRRLPPDLRSRHPDIEWNEIAAAGSVYRHAYQLVRDDAVWKTVHHNLEPLLAMVERELRRLKSSS